MAAIPMQCAAAFESSGLPLFENAGTWNGANGSGSAENRRESGDSHLRHARRPLGLHLRSTVARPVWRRLGAGSFSPGRQHGKGDGGMSGFGDESAQRRWLPVCHVRSHDARRQSGAERLDHWQSEWNARLQNDALFVLLFGGLPIGHGAMGRCAQTLVNSCISIQNKRRSK